MGSLLGRRRLAGADNVVRNQRKLLRLRGNGGGGKLPEPGGGFHLRNGGTLMKHEPENVTWSDYLLAALLCAVLALGFAYAA